MKNLILFLFSILLFTACGKDDTPGETANNLPQEFQSLKGIFNGQGVGAATNIADNIILLFSSNGQEYAWYEDNEIKKTERIDKEDGLFDGYALGTVGGAIDYEEERLIFFNTTGSVYQWSRIDPDAVEGTSDVDTLIEFDESTFGLHEWGVDHSCPFDGLGALMGFSKFPEGCTEVGDGDDLMWMINDDGDALVRYVKSSVVFDEEVELEQWRSQSVCGGSPAIFPMQSIGAACLYEDDVQSVQLYFSNSGKQFTIFDPNNGTYSTVFDL